jgi:hypothetical protein
LLETPYISDVSGYIYHAWQCIRAKFLLENTWIKRNYGGRGIIRGGVEGAGATTNWRKLE